MSEEIFAGIMAFAVPLALLVVVSTIFAAIIRRKQKINEEMRQRLVAFAVEAKLCLVSGEPNKCEGRGDHCGGWVLYVP